MISIQAEAGVATTDQETKLTSPVIYAAAYLLLTSNVPSHVPDEHVAGPPLCQLPPPQMTCPRGEDCDASGRPIHGHVTVRLRPGWSNPPGMEDDPRMRRGHHRRGHHWRRVYYR